MSSEHQFCPDCGKASDHCWHLNPELRNEFEFKCEYTTEQKYDMVCSGEYGVFEMFERDGSVSGYRGFRTGYGSTGIYDTYKLALEAAFIEFGHLKE